MTRAIALAFVAALACAAPVHGTTYVVDNGGGGDFWTIQEGVGAASTGDTVLFARGTYVGPQNRIIDFAGVDIVLRSIAGPAATIIDCEYLGRAFYFHSGETTNAVVEGFTIRYGSADEGGGIYCTEFSSCTVVDCVIEDCIAAGGYRGGGGICCIWESSTELYDCVIRRNETTMFGGGVVFMDHTNAVAERCVFENNEAYVSAGGLYIYYYADASVTDCTFVGNSAVTHHGGGMLIAQANPTIENCTLYGNSAPEYGGGIHIYESSPYITETIVAQSTDGDGISCSHLSVPSDPTIWNCCVFGNADGDSLCGTYYDNLVTDPLFCDAGSGDLTLCSDSECLPGNNAWGASIGAYGEGCDSCASSVWEDEETSWSMIKAIFR